MIRVINRPMRTAVAARAAGALAEAKAIRADARGREFAEGETAARAGAASPLAVWLAGALVAGLGPDAEAR